MYIVLRMMKNTLAESQCTAAQLYPIHRSKSSATAWYGGVAMTVESATIVGYRPDYGCFDKLPL